MRASASARHEQRVTTGRPFEQGFALFRRAFVDARIRTVTFAYLFAVYAYLQPAGYHRAYPTAADRRAFAHTFAGNAALRLFYGFPYNVMTVSGYTAWRVGGTLVLLTAAFGVLAAVRALRAEEDAGRTELVLAAPVGRPTAFRAAMAAIAAGAAILWLAQLAGFVAGGLPVAGSAYLALATVSVVPVFAGIGALASQLAPTRRSALSLGSAAVAVSWLLRVIGDTWNGGAWLRFATPLGWAEELRPFTGARPLVLLLPLATSALLVTAASRISTRRDIGAGLWPARDTAEPSSRLLSSPIAQGLRAERGTLTVWMLSIAAFATILGMVAASISSAGISANLRKEFAKLGTGSITTPTGYLPSCSACSC